MGVVRPYLRPDYPVPQTAADWCYRVDRLFQANEILIALLTDEDNSLNI